MITIVGAGLVGSLWAILLRKKGYEVSLFERRPDPRRQILDGGRSINLVITSRGLYGLEKAGLLSKVKELSVPVYGRMIHPKKGDWVYQPYGQEQECNLSISRADLNLFLISEAEKAGALVYFNHELDNIEARKKEIYFKTPSGLSRHSYQILFGADGAGSRVRKNLAQQFPAEIQEHTDWLEADYKELVLPKLSSGEPALDVKALHIWPRGAHMMMALANRDGSFTITVYLPRAGQGWSFDRLKTTDDVQRLFAEEFPDAVPLMPSYLKDWQDHPQGALGTVRCSQWVIQDSVALMGDAAHAIVPFFGQGMNCGFEDCTVLYDLIEKGRSEWPDVLRRYEKERKSNAQAIADMALENWVEMRDKVADPKFLLRKKVESLLEQRFPGQYKSRYGLITYTLIPYSVAQKCGIKQNQILDRLLNGVSSPEQINAANLDNVMTQEWLPFVDENDLKIETYQPL